MTQMTKAKLPASIRAAQNRDIAIRFSEAFFLRFGERIVDWNHRRETHATFLPPIAIPSSFIYSKYGYDQSEDRHLETLGTDTDIDNDFNQGRPEIGKISPITWKENNGIVTPNAYRITIPHKLTSALNSFTRDIGLTDLARGYILSEKTNIEPGDFRLHRLGDGNVWYAQRPENQWHSDMHWISPADEKGHENYLRILRENGFLSVLNIIGNELGLDSLAAYHLTFIVVAHCEEGYIHKDTNDTGNRTFNVIIPLEMVSNSPPELIIQGADEPELPLGRLQYEEDVAIVLGDNAMHATSEVDYRQKPGAMRLAATVYITDVNEDNVNKIASNTLTQIFPPKDADWIYAQRGRHWINAKYRSGADSHIHFSGDLGRDHLFSTYDDDSCNGWKEEEPAFCTKDVEKRVECPVMCGLFLDGDYFVSNFSTDPWLR